MNLRNTGSNLVDFLYGCAAPLMFPTVMRKDHYGKPFYSVGGTLSMLVTVGTLVGKRVGKLDFIDNQTLKYGLMTIVVSNTLSGIYEVTRYFLGRRESAQQSERIREKTKIARLRAGERNRLKYRRPPSNQGGRYFRDDDYEQWEDGNGEPDDTVNV